MAGLVHKENSDWFNGGPNFAIRTAKMDYSRNYFGELFFQFTAQNKHLFVE